MDRKSREIIHDYKQCLSEVVSLEKIKVLLKEYKIFTQLMLDDIYGGEEDFYDELCTRGPNAFSNFIKILREANYLELAELLQKKSLENQLPLIYNMDKKLPGYCLIIINKDFDGEDPRKSSEADAILLNYLFEEVLKFDVKIERNLNAEKMKNVLKEFSKKREFKNDCCCIVYILSHGGQEENNDFIFGTDWEIVFKNDIYKLFNDDNCELLRGKPKIFFFQACRGKLLDPARTERSVTEKACQNIASSNSDSTTQDLCTRIRELTVTLNFPISDTFIIHPCLPNHTAWVNNETGSWLAQDLAFVIPKYFDQYDFATMMTMVCDKQINRVSEDGFKQILHFEQKGVTRLLKFKKHPYQKKSHKLDTFKME